MLRWNANLEKSIGLAVRHPCVVLLLSLSFFCPVLCSFSFLFSCCFYSFLSVLSFHLIPTPNVTSYVRCSPFREIQTLKEFICFLAVYIYASQHSNPKLDTLFWKTWYDFETQHGNKETFKEMLRVRCVRCFCILSRQNHTPFCSYETRLQIRRSVSAQFATTNVVDAAAALSLSGFRRGGVVAGTVQPPAGSIGEFLSNLPSFPSLSVPDACARSVHPLV